MILADSSVWITYIAKGHDELDAALEVERVVCHPYVIGELALGSLGRHRETILDRLAKLPSLAPATPDEVLALIRTHKIFSRGIGYVDANLLASTILKPSAVLMSQDRRLNIVAEELGVAA